MKFAFLATVLVAAVAMAGPAEAAKKKRKPAQQPQRAVVSQVGPTDVFDSDRVVGRDPDPFIRAMIQRDPRPWETSD